MNNALGPQEILQSLTQDDTLLELLEDDLLVIQSHDNRKLAWGLLAALLAEGELAEGSELQSSSRYSREFMQSTAAEVEPKTYAAGEVLDDLSEVLRGLARAVNALRSRRHKEAADIAGRISWPMVRRVALLGIWGAAIRNGDAQAAAHLAAEFQPESPPATTQGDSPPRDSEEDDRLRMEIELALAEIIPPGSTFPLSHAVIDVTVRDVDASRGKADLHIGACRYTEGVQFAPFLERELKQRIPELQSVGVGMLEL